MQILTQLFALPCAFAACIRSRVSAPLTVEASTGIYTGTLSENYTTVREFRNVPYALPAIDSRRWLPPQNVPLSNKTFDSTKFPPSCPQYVSRIPSVWNQVVPEYLIYTGNQSKTAGLAASSTSEDCLSLAVWTPSNATNASSLPVAMFMTGGGFVTGGINIPYQLPQRWVARTQGHIVVTINYRVNIMGFPNAAGLESQNLGLLDQRAALEWVRSNIRYFGGDPSAVTLWGQSAGSASTDFQNFAFYRDPIARAFFMQSGAVANRAPNPDFGHTNFTFVAKSLGCDFPRDSAAELDCMRKVPFDVIENFVGQYQDNSTSMVARQTPISFVPITDEKIVFSNYTARYAAGMVTKAPALMSTCANEGASLSPYPVNNPTGGINQEAADVATRRTLCGVATSSSLRHSAGLTTYRYQYVGNWSNIAVLPWMGAYHASDLPMLFGAYDVARGSGTAPEQKTSQVMEDFLFAYLRDPYNGPKIMGWPPFDPTGEGQGTIMRFGADGRASQTVTGAEVDGVCSG